MKKKKRHFLTLIEIMVVIVLIGLITGVLAFNMRGSLSQGKAFKTEQGGGRVYRILMMEVATGRDISQAHDEWKAWLAESSLVKDVKELSVDGWGHEYSVEVDGDDIKVISQYYKEYQDKKFPGVPHDGRLT